ncbi:EAL domain-containing protein [Salmonella enterica]|nr:EAL domain-containing protein [Salmonella enterica]
MNSKKMLTLQQIEQAIREDRLIPFFQPLISSSTGILYGAEVLARIIDLKDGLLTPDRFIACVEGSDLIVSFTLTLMRKVIPVMTNLSATRSVMQDNIIVAFNTPANVLRYPELLLPFLLVTVVVFRL